MTGATRNVHLSAELTRAYLRIHELSRELAEERALTRRLRTVLALADLASPAIKRYMPHPRRASR